MPTFEDIDNAWRTGTPNPYSGTIYTGTPSLATTTTSSTPAAHDWSNPALSNWTNGTGTSGIQPLKPVSSNSNGTVGIDPSGRLRFDTDYYQPQPAPTQATQSPGTAGNMPSLGTTVSSNNSFTDMYRSTFTNPLQYWNEYNQGQGARFTEGAARGMAKAGRTGMLPTLGMMAHQDYMSNYLPSVRKDLAAGVSSDTSRYSADVGYRGQVESAGISADASRYAADRSAEVDLRQLEAQKEMNALDNLTKTYQVDEQTKTQIYNSWASLAPHMSEEQRQSLITDIELELAKDVAGNETLADITTPTVTPVTKTPREDYFPHLWLFTHGIQKVKE